MRRKGGWKGGDCEEERVRELSNVKGEIQTHKKASIVVKKSKDGIKS